MAQAIAQEILCDPRFEGYTVDSAGVMAVDGCSASQGAIKALTQIGLDASTHSSKMLTAQIVSDFDIILTMTNSHKEAVCYMFPEFQDKVHLLSSYAGKLGDIPDPFGQSLGVYVECRDCISECIQNVFEKLAENKVEE